MKPLKTKRCLLRKWQLTDLEALRQIFYCQEIANLAGFKVRKNEHEIKEVLKTFIIDSEHSLWAIELLENKKAIGWIEIHPFESKEEDVYELGFALNKHYWGKALMPEVIERVIEEIRMWGKINQVVCAHFDFNQQSKRAIQKCGFCFMRQQGQKLYYSRKLKVTEAEPI